MSRLAGLLRRTFGIAREHVGTDHHGNKYYRVPEQKTWTGRMVRARRLVEAANPTEYEYVEGSIPSEWDAWIRGRRKQPPSIEELLQNERSRELMKTKARAVDQRDLELQAQEVRDGLLSAASSQTQVKGHAAATSFGKEQISEEPSSTANTFQPGSWMPGAAKK